MPQFHVVIQYSYILLSSPLYITPSSGSFVFATDDGYCSSEACFVTNSKLCASTSKILYYTNSARCKLKNFKKWSYYVSKWLWVYIEDHQNFQRLLKNILVYFHSESHLSQCHCDVLSSKLFVL